MKILIVVFEALLGGHVLSAETVGLELQKSGHEVIFAGKRGRLSPRIEKTMSFLHVDIPLTHGLRETYFTWKSLRAVGQIRSIIREKNIELVHAFDARSYMHCYPAAFLEDLPITCTLCGGIDPFYNLPRTPKIIVFSEEQRDKMINQYRWPIGRVEVIRTRLDMSGILDRSDEITLPELAEFEIDSKLPKIMMISSFDSSKIASVFQVLKASEILYERGLHFQLVLIGGKGALHEEAKNVARQINRRFGENVVVLTGQVVKAYRLLKRARVVIGVGRSAFEGMAFGLPTVIVGVNGFAGVMEPDRLEKLEYYNFSGRNQSSACEPKMLAGELERILTDHDLSHRLANFGRDFVMAEIDVKVGVGRIEALYRLLAEKPLSFRRFGNVLSFLKCLLPIIADNSYHTFKRALYSVRGKKFPVSADIEAGLKGKKPERI